MQMSFKNIPSDEGITIEFPGCVIRIHNELHTDDGIVTVEVDPRDSKVQAYYTRRMTTSYLAVYGPHEGEAGHYNPDGTQESPDSGDDL